MALDGVVISNMIYDLDQKLIGGRITKIYQPEDDEILLVIKNERETYRLFLSASASLPLLYLVSEKKENPMIAPNFCMLLRKHINNGRIIAIAQPGMERIMDMTIEHLDEMGDVCQKHLIIEIMGKHSNIIFCDDSYQILDSIKHISLLVSSVREVLPGKKYEYPPNQGKDNPLLVEKEAWITRLKQCPMTLQKAIYTTLTGISPLVAAELCYRAKVEGDRPVEALYEPQLDALYDELCRLRQDIKEGTFVPNIVYENGVPVEFSSILLTSYEADEIRQMDDISSVLETYYAQKNLVTKIRQKSAELRHIVATAVERTAKKLDIQQKQLKDTEKREKYKIYGELLQAYSYEIAPQSKSYEALNYYTNETITIPLDPNLSPMENANKYFKRYAKLKRTYEALCTLTVETREELMHLRSVQVALELAMSENDLAEIKEELVECGYMKRRARGKKECHQKSKPLHFLSSDGFHMYVGKNNFQNDELTFKVANAGDFWFHANDIPGSHVIVKKEQAEDLPDATYIEAARLAAYYSSGRGDSKVEVDYTRRGNIKKPAGAKPGYVIYHTNYSMNVAPDITGIEQIG